ncbi:MAG TPA: sulfotransferase [Acidimicrobiales bacterium]|nr:sulfotransferase [Acidimicrobiales bacterium]
MSTEPDRLSARRESIYDTVAQARQRTAPFDPSASPLFEHVGFVVGAPRSGTTWLQQLLFTHPLIATGGESHLFCEVLPPAFENFFIGDSGNQLHTWVSRDELLTIARQFADSVFLAQRNGTRPDATLVLEKTPNHQMQSALQAELYPDARYVHIIRDGRDATSSQRANWKTLSSDYTHPAVMARAWAAEVRDIRAHFGNLAYLELRYEDIVRDTPAALAQIFEHFRLPYDATLCEEAAEFGRAPVNMFGSSKVGVRKREGDTLAERSVARAAGGLLTELGYADEAEVARLARLRTPATVAYDARDAIGVGAERARNLWARAKRRVRREFNHRKATPVKAYVNDFAAALEARDETRLASLLDAEVAIGGKPPVAAAAAATDLIGRFGDSRLVHRNVFGGQAQLTFVSPQGDRVVVGVTPRDGRAGAFEIL